MNMKYRIMTILLLSYASLCVSAQQSLGLDDCISLALQNNRTLQNAALEITSGREQQREMRAKYLPEITANAMAFHTFEKVVDELNRGYSATLSVMLPLYAGGQITTANKLAAVGSDVASLQQVLSQQQVVQKVTENYWKVVQLKYNMQTLDATQQQLDAVENQVSNYVETGVATRNALLQVRLRKQELASNRLKVQHADQLLRLLLAQQIGIEQVQIALPNNDSNCELPDWTTISGVARPEQILAGKAIEAQRLQVKMERGKCLPTVAVGVMGFQSQFGSLSPTMRKMLDDKMTNGLGLASVSIPISAWFGGNHAIKRAKVKLQQSQNDYHDACEQLAIDTESSRLTVIEAFEQIGIARTSVEEAAENLRMATEQYRVGKTTLTDLLDAETLNRQSQDQLSSAIADYQIKLADYKRKLQPANI